MIWESVAYCRCGFCLEDMVNRLKWSRLVQALMLLTCTGSPQSNLSWSICTPLLKVSVTSSDPPKSSKSIRPKPLLSALFVCARAQLAPSLWRFLDHIPSSTPLNKWSACRRGRYLRKTRETNIHALSGIQTHNPRYQCRQTHSLDHTATRTGFYTTDSSLLCQSSYQLML